MDNSMQERNGANRALNQTMLHLYTVGVIAFVIKTLKKGGGWLRLSFALLITIVL